MLANLPNLLSASRIAAVPVLLLFAWQGATSAFLVLFALALLTDVLDGQIARRFGHESEFGARLDQWGDFSLWCTMPVGAWWLWPETMTREAPYVVLAILAMVLPTAIGYAKYREVPGYHTWSVKFGAGLMAASVPLLLIFDVGWPFRVAALFQLVCAVDELGITILLPDCRHDIPSVFHAMRLRRYTRR